MKLNRQRTWGNRFLFLLFSITLFESCTRDLSKPSSTPGAAGIPPRAANEVVNSWLTTSDQSQLLQPQTSINFAADAGTNATTITVDEKKTYQSIDGFGYCPHPPCSLLLTPLCPGQTSILNN